MHGIFFAFSSVFNNGQKHLVPVIESLSFLLILLRSELHINFRTQSVIITQIA